MRIKHVSFLTSDLTAALDFYALLGAEVVKRETTPAEGYGRAVLALGGGRVQLFEIAGQRPQPHPHWAEHLALEVADVPALAQQLTQAGHRLSREVQRSPGGRWMAFVLDPDGRQIELLELRDAE